MSKEKTSEKYERQIRYRESKAKGGQRQISLWLSDETIKQLDDLAKDSSRATVVTYAISDLNEEKKKSDVLEKGQTTYGKDSDYGKYS